MTGIEEQIRIKTYEHLQFQLMHDLVPPNRKPKAPKYFISWQLIYSRALNALAGEGRERRQVYLLIPS